MMVGTRETTNTAMKELLSNEPGPIISGSRWWIPALVAGITAIVLILLKKMNLL